MSFRRLRISPISHVAESAPDLQISNLGEHALSHAGTALACISDLIEGVDIVNGDRFGGLPVAKPVLDILLVNYIHSSGLNPSAKPLCTSMPGTVNLAKAIGSPQSNADYIAPFAEEVKR